MASLLQQVKNMKANLGTAATEMQHLANQLQGQGADEKKFLEAVSEGKSALAASLLSQNPNVIYARSAKDWYNAWHIAAQAGSLPVLEVLHTHGRGGTRKPLPGEPAPHVARTREKRETPLMLACAADHLTAMQYLLGVGASAHEADKYGNTIVHYAALKGQVKMLSLLLASDEGQPHYHAPHSAAIPTGVDGPAPAGSKLARLVDVRNEAGLQPLHFAVWGGNAEAVRTVLEHRPDLNSKSTTDSVAQVTCNGGSTALHVAALRNDPAMVELLLKEYVQLTLEGRGPSADPRTVTDKYRFNAWQIAKDLKRDAVVSLVDPSRTLKGLEPGAVAAALAAGSATFRRLTSTRSSGSSTNADRALAATSAISSVDPFDGFAALAAGTLVGRKANGSLSGVRAQDARSGGSLTAGGPVPILAPPPPPGAKTSKSNPAIPVPILTPPPAAAAGASSFSRSALASPSTQQQPTATGTPAGSNPAAPENQQAAAPPDAPPVPTQAPQQAADEQQAPPAPAQDSSSGHQGAPSSTSPPDEQDKQHPAHTHQPDAAQQPASGGAGGGEDAAGPPPPPAAAAGTPPERFLCPITNQVMNNPVLAADGRAYEADAIAMWFSLGNSEFPGGTTPISSQDVAPASDLLREIQQWREQA